ncbi:hypothetical protein LTR53_020274, partial [Teratosphaeriaceae sp. CCFEE 6253]
STSWRSAIRAWRMPPRLRSSRTSHCSRRLTCSSATTSGTALSLKRGATSTPNSARNATPAPPPYNARLRTPTLRWKRSSAPRAHSASVWTRCR